MRLLALSVLLAWLAVLRGSGWWFEARKEVDFAGLDKYLRQKLRDDADLDANLAAIEKDADKLPVGAKKAGRVVLQLSRLREEAQCDDHLVASLQLASEGRLEAGKNHRLAMLVGPQLKRAVELCARHVGRIFNQTFESTDPKVFELSDRIGAYSPHLPLPELIGQLLQVSSKGDPKSSQIFKQRDAFNYALESYLLEPCEQVATTFDNLLPAAAIVSSVQLNSKLLDEAHFDRFRRLARSRGVCRRVASLSGSQQVPMVAPKF